jgi:hypothetical protein
VERLQVGIREEIEEMEAQIAANETCVRPGGGPESPANKAVADDLRERVGGLRDLLVERGDHERA